MMMAYGLAAAYGLVLLFAWIGWGAALNRVLFGRRHVDWGQRAAWGMAACIAVGGVLEMTSTVSPLVIRLMIGIGLVLALVDLILRFAHREEQRRARRVFAGWPRSLVVVAVLLLAFIGLRYLGWVAASDFNAGDDLQGYLVFPERMLQTGAIGDDPFNERRLMTGLGAQSYLLTFALVALPMECLHVLDPGLTWLVAAGLILGCVRRRSVSPQSTVLLLLLLGLVDPHMVNLTAEATALMFFLAIGLVLSWDGLDEAPPAASAALIALLFGAVCSIKSSFIPPAAVMFLVSYGALLRDRTRRRRTLVECGLAIAMGAALLVPWMVSMYRSCGTPLYPLLGKGFYGAASGTFDNPWSEVSPLGAAWLIASGFLRNPPAIVMLLLAAIAWKSRRAWPAGRAPLAALCVGSIAGTIALQIATGGYASARYTFPFVLASIIALLLSLGSSFRPDDEGSASSAATPFFVVLMVGTLAGAGYRDTLLSLRSSASTVLRGASQPLADPDDVARYGAMQAAVPAGATLLTRVERPYLLDFRRQNIFVVDLPGGASLPPGMPFFVGPEPLAEYLTALDIRYVAYSYANEMNFRMENRGVNLDPSTPYWIRTNARHIFDFQSNLRELGQSRARVFDDGDIFVIDLLDVRGADG